MLRGKCEQQVVNVIARQDGKRPRGGQATIEQRLPQRQYLCVRLAVTQSQPIGTGSPAEQRPFGRDLRPVLEAFGEDSWVGPERLHSPHQHTPVGALLDHRRQIAKTNLPPPTVRPSHARLSSAREVLKGDA